MRRLAAVLAVSVLALCAVPAIAAAPKYGTYIDVKLQAYISVNKTRTAISSLSAPCQAKFADGSVKSSGGFSLPKSKHPKLTRSGAFSYKGNVTLVSGSGAKAVVKVEITGALSGGKLKGKVTLDEVKTGCTPYSYSAKYYGVNPQG